MIDAGLEKRCFLLGYNSEHLPPEPGPLDRECYNLGMDVRRMGQELKGLGGVVNQGLRNLNEAKTKLEEAQKNPPYDYGEQKLYEGHIRIWTLGSKEFKASLGEWQARYQEIVQKHPVIAACSTETEINQLYEEISGLLQIPELEENS